MFNEILNAGLDPFTSSVGWQAFAFGLLGRKAIKRTSRTLKRIAGLRGQANPSPTDGDKQ